MKTGPVDDLLDKISLELYGLTRTNALKLGMCVACKKVVKGTLEGEDKDEWNISALCPDCFDMQTLITEGELEEDENEGE